MSDPGTTPLQATQSEVLGAIQADTLFSASLWVNIALAGLSILLFVYMGRDIESPRARLIWVATLLVPLVSLSSYVGLASGLTVGFLAMPPGHPLAGELVLTPWGRYLTWTLSTPMILLALGLLADTDLATLFTAITMDIAMCVTGLAAALITSSYALRWAFFGISSAFFLAVLYVLLVEWPDDAAAAGTSDIFGTLKLLTVVLWLGYPLFWALGTSGIAVLSTALTSWGYSALDIVAKYVFAYLLLSWVADNEGAVANAGVRLGGTEGTAAVDD
ncbi:bacteriorhodopsin [Haloarcula onubensis]|uniref:Bacteriorhodopsin n=1 Tax=Haloarcula onubensis TaxID=2950539 RepID=A0ABU2FJX4_9EURY|nr:bacteriorhodopsin [Halomicroarcula sp. S3CR25-11]MDS0281053.1 bacteriorhodopsin [Halomicroarcula sp. S3CR25-11]